MQYTIESRELTSERTQQPRLRELRKAVIEAEDPGEAISRFVDESESELLSFMSRRRGEESIATVRKNDSFFLVRVYES